MSSTKRFTQVVSELKALIQEENLHIGDKLPSERELTERLQVGRSSVREALRSLELLGLIETRRGEGTFLADYKHHRLLEVLATFIIREERSLYDVHETRLDIEEAAFRKVASSPSLKELPVWSSLLEQLLENGSISREDFLRELIVSSQNRLALRIWFILYRYSERKDMNDTTEEEYPYIERILKDLIAGSQEEAIRAFEEWRTHLTRSEQK